MRIFKNKGEFTKFQILAKIAQQEPHLKQKDIADELGITVQAVSENIKTLVKEGYGIKYYEWLQIYLACNCC